MQSFNLITCESCNHEHAIVSWNKQYHGKRGTCLGCGYNWPES